MPWLQIRGFQCHGLQHRDLLDSYRKSTKKKTSTTTTMCVSFHDEMNIQDAEQERVKGEG